jgi:prepilin-type N-terminal cleavage/methylation domain-containing protein
MKTKRTRGYTLIELIVSVGLFALVMTLAAGAYVVVIGVNRQTQGISSGIDTLSFALETMTRTIRTGTSYGVGGPTFSVLSSSQNTTVSYALTNYTVNGVTYGAITQTTGSSGAVPLTDPSVNITSLNFYATGVNSYSSNGDKTQARVTIVVSGTVSSGPGKTVSFTVQTSATMRGSDI